MMLLLNVFSRPTGTDWLGIDGIPLSNAFLLLIFLTATAVVSAGAAAEAAAACYVSLCSAVSSPHTPVSLDIKSIRGLAGDCGSGDDATSWWSWSRS